MPYKISKRHLLNASRLGVTIAISSNPRKKLDVFKNGKKISEIGAIGYNDYVSYIYKNGLVFANERRRLYKIRHENDRNVRGTAGYYADKILWN